MELENKLRYICESFCIPGVFSGYRHLKIGNVNQTYRVFFDMPNQIIQSYIVQKVNTYAFREPELLMHNAALVTEHVRRNSEGQTCLHYLHTEDHKSYLYDDEGGFWRVSNFISSHTFDNCGDVAVLQETGAAFGSFQKLLSSFSAADLYETIPYFHHTPRRLKNLFENAEKDPVGRVHKVREELEYIRSVRDKAERLTRLYEEEKLPLRVTHNDTKINNVLFDRQTNKAIAVIDLDTVMPGLIGHDFGDGVRFAANVVEEDCADVEKVSFSLERFEAFARGFLNQAGSILTRNEIDTLALSAFCITIELASRFLDDYIVGDLYFKTNYPEHNLVRTRCQLALAKDIDRKLDQMQKIIENCMAEVQQG